MLVLLQVDLPSIFQLVPKVYNSLKVVNEHFLKVIRKVRFVNLVLFKSLIPLVSKMIILKGSNLKKTIVLVLSSHLKHIWMIFYPLLIQGGSKEPIYSLISWSLPQSSAPLSQSHFLFAMPSLEERSGALALTLTWWNLKP